MSKIPSDGDEDDDENFQTSHLVNVQNNFFSMPSVIVEVQFYNSQTKPRTRPDRTNVLKLGSFVASQRVFFGSSFP